MNHSKNFVDLVNHIKPLIKEINLSEFKRLQSTQTPFHLLDVREDHEWVQGHIPGATHLGKGIIERDIERLVPNRQDRIVLYCGGGYRSALAAYNLQQMGYENVISLDGGYKAWLLESNR